MKPASRFKRILAYIVDAILVSIPTTILMIIVGIVLFIFIGNIEDCKLLITRFNSSFMILMMSLYFALFESSKYQATPGKKLFNLYVSDLESRKLSFIRALSRYFALVLFAVPVCVLQITSDSLIDYVHRVQNQHWIFPASIVLSLVYLIPVFLTKDRKTGYDILTSSRVCCRKLGEFQQKD